MLYLYIFMLVQIVLESLPVSSSGHLKLLKGLLKKFGLHLSHTSKKILFFKNNSIQIDIFSHLLHGPTVFIVMFFFRDSWWMVFKQLKRFYFIIFKVVFFTILADLMTILFFIFLKLFPCFSMPLGIGFIITALLLYSLRWCKKEKKVLGWKTYVALGCVQGIALLPGISRFAAVYVSARWLGLPERKAFAITWLIQWPLILVAFIQGVYVAYCAKQLTFFLNIYVLCILLLATVLAYILLCLASYLVNTHKIWLLSIYMILPILGWFILLQ